MTKAEKYRWSFFLLIKFLEENNAYKKFFVNASNAYTGENLLWFIKVCNLNDFHQLFEYAFTWECTPEGQKFWEKLYFQFVKFYFKERKLRNKIRK